MHERLVRSLRLLLRPIVWAVLRLGWGLEVSGAHHLPRRGGFIVAANHVSFLDPVVVAVACPRRVVFLARAALFELPVLGGFLRFVRAIPVDRHHTEVGLRSAVRLLRRGQPIAMFPEGGRQLSGALGQARPGVAFLAAGAQVPIIPLVLDGTRSALPPGARWLRRAKIRVAFGPQIRYPERRLSPEACARLARQVTASWQRLRESQWTNSSP